MRDFPVTAEPEETLEQKLMLAFGLFEAGENVMMQNLRRRHPDADDAEIERLFRAWLQERPGAELGDADGRPCRRSTLEV